MCGIVGYAGHRPAVPILVSGLERVEYRGYDSAGMVLPATKADFLVCKRKGKIAVFKEQLASENLLDFEGKLGIAHTRWATHGDPSDANAHPHLSCRQHVAVVHNGIITNFFDLKKMLESRNHIFTSETDTEVLAHLIGEYLDGDPLEAVRSALVEVEGTYGLAVVFRDYPEMIVFARQGSPLCIGLGEGEHFIASDAASFIKFTKQQIILEDGQIGYITSDKFEIMDFDKVPISPKVETIDYELEQIEKAGYSHFMLKEICEQSQSLQNSLGGRLDDNGIVKLGGLEDHRDLLRSLQSFFFVAAGTSLYAGMIGKILFQEISKVSAHYENASELANQNYPYFLPNTGIWAISQSGETADLLLAIKQVKKQRLPVFGICNVVGSTVARQTAAGVYVNAGPEIGVASTKAFTSQVMVLHLIAVYLHQLHRLEKWPWMSKYLEDLRSIPGQVASIVERREEIAKVAKKYAGYKNFLFLGRGVNFPVALEGALKLKEISYIHAEGYSAGEMKHGPLAMIDENFPTVVIAPQQDDYYSKILSNISEITARKGPVLALANEGDDEIAKYVDDVIYIPRTTYYLLPFLFVVPLQLFAYYVAVELGCNIDQPRNLAKAVTVE